MARRSLVHRLQLRAGGGGVWKPHRDMDHSCPQANEDGDELLSAKLGVFGLVDGRVQHFDQLYLRGSWRVVLRESLLQIPQLLPGHIRVCEHLLHDRDSCGQVGF